MQTRPAMMPFPQNPRPNASTSSGAMPRSSRYGCDGSRVRAKPSGLLAFGSAALPGALSDPPEARGDALAGVDGPFQCCWARRPVLGLPSALAHVRRAKFSAADLSEQDARAPKRDGFPVPVLHPVHEVEHV